MKYIGLTALMFVLASWAMLSTARADEHGDTLLLTGGSQWRKHYTFFPPRLSAAEAEANNIDPGDIASRIQFFVGRYRSPSGNTWRRYVFELTTPPPAKGWSDPDFDDSGWLRKPGFEFSTRLTQEKSPEKLLEAYSNLDVRHASDLATGIAIGFPQQVAGVRGFDAFNVEVGLIALRGRFVVEDPAKVRNLTLSLTYRGGFVAKLNGVEIARGHLPEGDLAYDTPAEDYPHAAFINADGKPGLFDVDIVHALDDPMFALRERSAGPITIDAQLLRAGVNVLTLQLHRSDYPALCAARDATLMFGAVGLAELTLAADTPESNVITSLKPADGLRVWNTEIFYEVRTSDFGNPVEELHPIRIHGAGNGTFSGSVVVGSTQAIHGLRATAGPLRSKDGATIPQDAVRVRYGVLNPRRDIGLMQPFTGIQSQRLDLLLDTPPDPAQPYELRPITSVSAPTRRALGLPEQATEVAVVPVWLTMHVAPDQAPGEYHGELTIETRDAPEVRIPVELHIAHWVLPDVPDYRSTVLIAQSPARLVEQYDLAWWSEEHLEAIENSFRLMAQLGNNQISLKPLQGTEKGGEPMVTRVQQEDGTYTYDFSALEAYLDAALRAMPASQVNAVIVEVWRFAMGRDADRLSVRVRDAASGKVEDMQLPPYASAECEAFLKPILTGIRERLDARGIGDRMLWGTTFDAAPPPDHVAMLRNILPDVRWFRVSHIEMATLPYDLSDRQHTVPVAVTARVPRDEYTNAPGRHYQGFRDRQPLPARHDAYHTVLWSRLGTSWFMHGFNTPWMHRGRLENAIIRGYAGIGNTGADAFAQPRGFAGFFCHRYHNARQIPGEGRSLLPPDILAPGPRGATHSINSENMREGLQETEARLFIERALADNVNPLPAELAKRCRELLEERVMAIRTWDTDVITNLWTGRTRTDIPFGAIDAKERTRRLYELAAQVSRAWRDPEPVATMQGDTQ